MAHYSKFLFLMLTCISFSCCHKNNNENATIRDFSQDVSSQFSKIVIPYATRATHKYHLRFADSELYYNDQKIQGLRLIFSTQNIFELRQARGLIVDIVEGLLAEMNADGDIIDAFQHFPITADDLEIYIAYESWFVTYVDPTYIGWVTLIDGYVRYYNGILKDSTKDYWGERIESYDKALEFTNLFRETEQDINRGKRQFPYVEDVDYSHF